MMPVNGRLRAFIYSAVSTTALMVPRPASAVKEGDTELELSAEQLEALYRMEDENDLVSL